MLSKMRSLSFKLTVFYIISVVIVVTGIIAYIEYNNYQREISDAVGRAEVGPGFINGATPDNSPLLAAVTNNSVYSLKASDIKNHLERFKPFVDETVASPLVVFYGWPNHYRKPGLLQYPLLKL